MKGKKIPLRDYQILKNAIFATPRNSWPLGIFQRPYPECLTLKDDKSLFLIDK